MADSPSKTQKLEELARAEFSNLTEAELKLIRGATIGEFAVSDQSTDRADPSNDPARADSWANNREIRAKLVQWLCTNQEAIAFIDARGLMVGAAKITGELDLSFATVPFPLLMVGCQLTGVANFQYAKLILLSLYGSVTQAIAGDRLVARALQLKCGFSAEGEV